ncbi:phosphoribosyltransferase-like protein [Zychaea mexicana]|uniref:phosphoribosyltransferase-like protein n=1 Tax=Zychaea mexicana TaxID=64656 RepID=UPI0022FDE73B|nr:phosphoribosyltransferase-like protein [Zychaea mexicana]KAI9498093.1 phosphoribosyltransferase-like protein [Zychaea mexicana]
MKNLVVFGGSSYPELTAAVCNRLGISSGKSKLAKFSNNETSVEMRESVREQDVYIIQSGCGTVNDNLFELLIMINACKVASAKRITAVLPHFPYSRQPDVPYKASSGAPLASLPPATPRNDKLNTATTASTDDVSRQLMNKLAKVSLENNNSSGGAGNSSQYRQWVARSGTLVADLLTCAGADHIITMEMHDPQFQGFFDCPVDNLVSSPLMINYIRHQIPNYQDAVIVSPDAGGAKRATAIAEKLRMDFALVHKERRQVSTNKRDLMLVGDVRGKDIIIVDDVTDTSYTITRAARMLRENGARKIYALVCHAILSGNAARNIEDSCIDQLIVSNTIPQHEHLRDSPKIKVYDVAPIFSEAIRRTHFGESVSMLFDAQFDTI